MQVKQESNDYQLICTEHQHNYQFLSLARQVDQNRLLCVECLRYDQDNVKWEYELKDLIPLSIAMSSPESMIDQILQNQSSKHLKSIFKFCQTDLKQFFNDEIEKVEQCLKEIMVKIKLSMNDKLQECFNLQNQFKKERDAFLSKIKYNEFQESLQSVQLSNQFKNELPEESIKRVSKIIDIMVEGNCALILESYRETFYNAKTNDINKSLGQLSLLQFKDEIEKPLAAFDKFVESFYIINSESKLLSKKFKKIILKQIEQQEPITYLNLIFQGQKENLNNHILWEKINEKKNLLMIFKAKQNQIFGGYSPCKWNQSLYNYVKDNSNNSFLFDQTLTQIYPLKQSQNKYAIFSSYEGPQFGQADISISSDFRVVQNWNKQESTYTDFLSSKYMELKIEECEIFEIIFT